MSIIRKNYFVVQNHVKSVLDDVDNSAANDPPKIIEPIMRSGELASARFPDWFIGAESKYRKIVRVLGATVNWVMIGDDILNDPTPLNSGYRLFSNISTRSNIPMVTVIEDTETAGKYYRNESKEGFVMMVNNYNSVKEFDITYENIDEVKFYLRPWSSYVKEDGDGSHFVDFVCELELLIVSMDYDS